MIAAAPLDVLVVGGGPAGCATAIAGVRLGLRVALLARPNGGQAPAGESLPPSVRPLLERLGVVEAFLATRPLPCFANRSVWGGGGLPREHSFLSEPYGSGWQIDRSAFDAMLLREAERAGVTVLRAALRPLERTDGGWIAATDGVNGAERIAARFTVDAGGRRRPVARGQGARLRVVDRLIAARWLLDARGDEEATTLVEATADGWWYSALLADGYLSVVFFSDPDLVRARGLRVAGGARALLAAAPATRARIVAAGCELTEPPRVVSAASGRLACVVGEGWLAAGDAAATYDPVSSHGVGAALDAGLAAASAVRSALDGDAAALDRYDRRVRFGFGRYLQLWRAVYEQEDRWPESPFWRRRHAAIVRSGAG